MIQVDISNIWSQVSLPQLLSVEPELASAHRAVVEGNGLGREYLGWTALPDKFPTAEHVRILAAAEHIRQSCEVLVVIGAGGAEAAPKAVAIRIPFHAKHGPSPKGTEKERIARR